MLLFLKAKQIIKQKEKKNGLNMNYLMDSEQTKQEKKNRGINRREPLDGRHKSADILTYTEN